MPCDECPVQLLDAAMESAAGLYIQQAIELQRARSIGVRFSFSDLTVIEYRILGMIEQEMPKPRLPK